MKTYVIAAALIAVCLLSIAAGIAKVARTPQEVDFYAQAGLGILPLVLLGAVQILGGALCVVARLRVIGLSLVTLGFLLSVLVIARTGNTGFAVISMLPAFLSGGLALFSRSRT